MAVQKRKKRKEKEKKKFLTEIVGSFECLLTQNPINEGSQLS